MPQLLGKEVGSTGFGLMGLTTRVPPVPVDQAIEAMRAALESGCNFWNVASHYGTPDWNTQKLLAVYFRQYPEDADKVVLSVKGTFDLQTMRGVGTPEGIKESMDKTLNDLDGTKKIDVFGCARVDPNVPVEDTLKYLDEEYVKKGVIGGISLSEVSAATIRRAVKVTKIAFVEVEVSLWSTHVLENGVGAACAEFDIPIVAYSPLGSGMLSGQFKSVDDLHKDDIRRMYPRFSPENFPINIELVKQLETIAKKKGCTASQLAISWVKTLAGKPGMPRTIIPIPGATSAARVRENAQNKEFTSAELAEIDAILAKFNVVGERYPDFVPHDG